MTFLETETGLAIDARARQIPVKGLSSLLPMFVGAMAVQTTALPSEISDKDFWRMIVDLSEPGGTYPYENFVSNELQYQDVVPALKTTTKPGGVYIGVGPEQNFPTPAVGPPAEATYSRLMNSTDITGRNSSFLATEEYYLYVREMQRKNLIVPLVGDFAGPAVIRNVGRYLTEHKTTVSVFYISNVETYLSDPQKQTFYANVATLPVDSSSMFIRHILGNPARGLSWWMPGMSNVSTVAPMSEFINQIQAGRQPTFQEIVRETKDPVVLGGLSR